METIKQLADRCGTHKTGIRRTIDRLGLADQLERDETGVIQVPDTVAEQVAAQYQNTDTTTQNEPEQTPEQVPIQQPDTLQTAIEALTAQLTAKDEQIAAMQSTITALMGNVAQLTDALTRAQALHAGTIQQQISSTAADEAGGREAPVTAPEPKTADVQQEKSEVRAAQGETIPEPESVPQTDVHGPTRARGFFAGLFGGHKGKRSR